MILNFWHRYRDKKAMLLGFAASYPLISAQKNKGALKVSLCCITNKSQFNKAVKKYLKAL